MHFGLSPTIFFFALGLVGVLDLAGVPLLERRREFLWNPPPFADQLLLRLPFGLSPIIFFFALGLVGVPDLAGVPLFEWRHEFLWNPPPFADQLLLRLPAAATVAKYTK